MQGFEHSTDTPNPPISSLATPFMQASLRTLITNTPLLQPENIRIQICRLIFLLKDDVFEGVVVSCTYSQLGYTELTDPALSAESRDGLGETTSHSPSYTEAICVNSPSYTEAICVNPGGLGVAPPRFLSGGSRYQQLPKYRAMNRVISGESTHPESKIADSRNCWQGSRTFLPGHSPLVFSPREKCK